MLSTDDEAYRIRKQLTPVFYDVYYKVFMRAMQEEGQITPILEMFLNFGFMDVQMVGEDNANALYDLTEHLDLCNSEHVYTMYEWLKAIYEGRKEPSKNEFDLDYSQYLLENLKTKKITEAQMKQLQDNRELKVKYEIQNMFTSGNRATYGKITTFCPILGEYDLINSVEKMLVTAERLEGVINQIRKIDFSVFYREVLFSDPDKGINHENIMKEVLPDIILMPNAGTKAMMWQETAGVKRDTSARFMFPVFTAVDLEDMMIETMGRYRWEICRKIQGVHWNDIREKSLTAEYCDYMQFYRKNFELSADAKEKLKNALFRAKNNYREVFVKDYLRTLRKRKREARQGHSRVLLPKRHGGLQKDRHILGELCPRDCRPRRPRARGFCRLDGLIPYNRFDRVHPRNQSLRRKVGDSLAREQARGARNKEAARRQGFVRHPHVQGEKIPRREARNNRRERQTR